MIPVLLFFFLTISAEIKFSIKKTNILNISEKNCLFIPKSF